LANAVELYLAKSNRMVIVQDSGGSRPGVCGGCQIRGRQKVFTCL